MKERGGRKPRRPSTRVYMIYELPTTVSIGDTEYKIRSDYRAILDICVAMNDPDLSDNERAAVALDIFYEDFDSMPAADYEEAVKECIRFINCGEQDTGKKVKPLMSWEQDFKYIAAPINRVIGQDVRSLPYLHWWSFISAYQEIGDCLFAQVVRIRQKLQRGKKLDKEEREFYRKNHDLVHLKTNYSEAEKDLLDKWL